MKLGTIFAEGSQNRKNDYGISWVTRYPVLRKTSKRSI